MSLTAAGLTPGALLPAVGRATRSACTGSAAEIWRLPADADRIATRLADLGRAGVGGFAWSGRDDDGMWLARTAAEPDLARWLAMNPGPIAWPRAIAMIASLAEATRACEQASLFPGAVEPAQLVVRGDAIELRADRLVTALIGGSDDDPRAGSRWLPPDAAGRPDNATNRYAIGLVAYQLLAGEHPFAGRGLRLGLEDQAGRGASPLPAAIASQLPPGLQSLCLRLLDPDPARRPASSAAIVDALRAITAARGDAATAAVNATATAAAAASAAAGATATASAAATVTAAASASASVRSTAPHRGRAALIGFAPIVVGIAVAWWLIVATGAPRAGAVAAVAATPLASARELADCASCHPRQAAEWSRSVMAHAIESPLFQSLEMLIEEQVGRDRRCPDGAGILRAAGSDPCTNPRTGLPVTGSGGALWCVNCHAPGENLVAALPPWDAHARDPRSREPLRDLLPAATMEGISCAACHQMTGPAHPGAPYEGNPSWTSPDSGQRFLQRPEDERGLFGIANSGYLLDPRALIAGGGELVPGGAHHRTAAAASAYQRSSEFCGACHDVRLFGTDAIAGVERGEHFKRLRNAYSEWVSWADGERRAGRTPASCQDCHMSLYPGVCVADPTGKPARGCPAGTRFDARPPGSYATGHAAAGSPANRLTTHYFSGVDVPLARAFDPAAVDDPSLDVAGVPLGARQRRDLLLASAFRFTIESARRADDQLEIPIVVENIGAGHRVPAGFSQEREIWVHLRVTDAGGRLVYEVGRVDRGDQDLRDKVFLRVNTSDDARDRAGRPLGLFGADVADGADVPRWDAELRGRGLVNFQNGFMRCVRCIGTIDARGQCQAGPGQESRRADRYADGDYDPDSGACRSNLTGAVAFLEVYFPIGALDATRGIAKGPDAIVDTRSLPPGRPSRYVYELATSGGSPFTVDATLEFRAFPPYLVRAFIDYEEAQARLGRRPSGPLVDRAVLDRLEVIDVATAHVVIP